MNAGLAPRIIHQTGFRQIGQLTPIFVLGLGSVLAGVGIALSPLGLSAVLSAACYAIVAFFWPQAVILTLIVVLPLDVYLSPSGGPGVFLSQVLVSIGFGAVVMSRVARRQSFDMPLALRLLWLLPAAGLVSLLRAPGASLDDFQEVLKLAGFPMVGFVIAACSESRGFLKRILICMIVANIVVVGYGLYQSVAGAHADPLRPLLNIQRVAAPLATAERQSSTFRYPTELAAYLLMTILVFVGVLRVGWARRGFCWRYLGFVTLLLANLVVMVLTFTRGAWLAVMVVWLLSIIGQARNRHPAGFLEVLSLVVLVGALLATVPAFGERILETFDVGSIRSYEGRRLVWLGGWQIFERYPWTGVGAGRLIEVALPVYAVSPWVANAENVYLTYLAEMGLLGLTAFALPLAAMSGTVWMGLRAGASKTDRLESALVQGMALAVVGTLLYAFVDPVFTSSQNGTTFWILAGLLASRLETERRDPCRQNRAAATRYRRNPPGRANPAPCDAVQIQ